MDPQDSASSSKETTEAEQQSYFFVVWPEESKSPSATTSRAASAEERSTPSCNSNVEAVTGVGSTPAVAPTLSPLTVPQPTLGCELGNSPHYSSCSSIRSLSPEQPPPQMQAMYRASVQNKAILQEPLDEPLRTGSNGSVSGIRLAHHTAASPSSASGLAASSTHVVPSAARGAGRLAISSVTSTDLLPHQRMPYKRDSVADSGINEIGKFRLKTLEVCIEP